MEEILMNQLKDKDNNCERLEAKVASLRKDLEKNKAQMNLNIKILKGSETLDNILRNQISPAEKTRLGYKEIHEATKGETVGCGACAPEEKI